MIIRSKRVWLEKAFRPADIQMEEGKIRRILPYGSTKADRDFGSDRIIPGMIDVHTHGASGYDVMSADPEGLRAWDESEPMEGVTSYLPSTYTAGKEVITEALRNIHAVKTEKDAERAGGIVRGAEILGAHLEGPFLSTVFKGAQSESNILKPEVQEFLRFQEAAGGDIRYVTIAPEEDEEKTLIRYCASHDVVVTMGHSAATYEETLEGQKAGASGTTHTFNAMSPLKHRAPGMVGAAMDCDDLYTEIIGDGCHVEFPAVRILFRSKDEDKPVLVTDSVPGKNQPVGQVYMFGEEACVITEKGLSVFVSNGTINGSTLCMNRGLQNLIEKAGIPEVKAIQAATCNPARLLRIADRKGYIREHYDADLTVLREDYTVAETFCMGVPQIGK